MKNEIKVAENQVWKAKGKKAKWTIWCIDGDNIALTREDILNPGMGGKRYEKHIHIKDLLKRYEKLSFTEAYE